MRTVIGIATFRGREKVLEKTLESLKGQAADIRVHHNSKGRDYADNAKFIFLKDYSEPVYYLSCDDDILYPPTYVKDMVEAIDGLSAIVTHHGRILVRENKSYYRGGHQSFRATGDVGRIQSIDVAGTGVSGWRTDYFNPVELYLSKDLRMADLVFSLEAKKQGKEIFVLPHNAGYLKAQYIHPSKTIHGQEYSKDVRQGEIANEIFALKNRK